MRFREVIKSYHLSNTYFVLGISLIILPGSSNVILSKPRVYVFFPFIGNGRFKEAKKFAHQTAGSSETEFQPSKGFQSS